MRRWCNISITDRSCFTCVRYFRIIPVLNDDGAVRCTLNIRILGAIDYFRAAVDVSDCFGVFVNVEDCLRVLMNADRCLGIDDLEIFMDTEDRFRVLVDVSEFLGVFVTVNCLGACDDVALDFFGVLDEAVFILGLVGIVNV